MICFGEAISSSYPRLSSARDRVADRPRWRRLRATGIPPRSHRGVPWLDLAPLWPSLLSSCTGRKTPRIAPSTSRSSSRGSSPDECGATGTVAGVPIVYGGASSDSTEGRLRRGCPPAGRWCESSQGRVEEAPGARRPAPICPILSLTRSRKRKRKGKRSQIAAAAASRSRRCYGLCRRRRQQMSFTSRFRSAIAARECRRPSRRAASGGWS